MRDVLSQLLVSQRLVLRFSGSEGVDITDNGRSRTSTRKLLNEVRGSKALEISC